MFKNGQTYFKNLPVFTKQDFQSLFGHFSTLCIKVLMTIPNTIFWSELQNVWQYLVLDVNVSKMSSSQLFIRDCDINFDDCTIFHIM